MRNDALEIFHAGLDAVRPDAFMRDAIRFSDPVLSVSQHRFNVRDYDHVFLIGTGKASAAMAQVMEEWLGEYISSGMIITKDRHALPLKYCACYEAGHPVPDERGVAVTDKMMEVLKNAGARDLIIYLLSGGTSSLLTAVPSGLSLRDVQETFRVLLRCGASIQDMNIIRKKVSRILGGRFSQLAFPATVVTLILSDVPDDDLYSIGSGPTMPDTSGDQDVQMIIEKYDLKKCIPQVVCTFLNEKINKTTSMEYFSKTSNFVLANIHTALKSCRQKAEELGYATFQYPELLTGEAVPAAQNFIANARNHFISHNTLRPCCCIAGGETVVSVTGSGTGGRNQEFALAALSNWNSGNDYVLLSAGTDGADGPADQAGAIADPQILQKAVALNINPHYFLKEHDSYQFFKSVGGHVFTGPTGTNVTDIIILLIENTGNRL